MGAPNPRPTMQEPSPCHWPHVDATLRNPSLLVSQSKYEQPVFASVEHNHKVQKMALISGRTKIFHQPRFPGKKGISLPLGVRWCEVAPILPNQMQYLGLSGSLVEASSMPVGLIDTRDSIDMDIEIEVPL